MRKTVLSLVMGVLLATNSYAAPVIRSAKLSDDVKAQSIQQLQSENVNYYQTSKYWQGTENVNWVYVGMVPRMQDPKRISITVSKVGYTARVTLEMTAQEVADYPQYLIKRADEMKRIFENKRLTVSQPTLLARFHKQVDELRNSSDNSYERGLALLKKNFPKNIFELSSTKANGAKVIAHFVYPVTLQKTIPGQDTARDGIYRLGGHSQMIERMVYHTVTKEVYDQNSGETKKQSSTDYVFGGFPAFWFYQTPNGIGLHGPIRFSETFETKDGIPMLDYWKQTELIKDYNKLADIETTVKTRWDLVRKRDSSGCIRSESLEIRHLLPSNQATVGNVLITLTSNWDQVEVNGKLTPINVDYYMLEPYPFPGQRSLTTKTEWFQQVAPQMLNQMNQVLDFPYLDPAGIELFNPQRSADPYSMALLNQAPSN